MPYVIPHPGISQPVVAQLSSGLPVLLVPEGSLGPGCHFIFQESRDTTTPLDPSLSMTPAECFAVAMSSAKLAIQYTWRYVCRQSKRLWNSVSGKQ